MIFTVNTDHSPKHLNPLLFITETVFTEQKKYIYAEDSQFLTHKGNRGKSARGDLHEYLAGKFVFCFEPNRILDLQHVKVATKLHKSSTSPYVSDINRQFRLIQNKISIFPLKFK
jgi:hypothetical protein